MSPVLLRVLSSSKGRTWWVQPTHCLSSLSRGWFGPGTGTGDGVCVFWPMTLTSSEHPLQLLCAPCAFASICVIPRVLRDAKSREMLLACFNYGWSGKRNRSLPRIQKQNNSSCLGLRFCIQNIHPSTSWRDVTVWWWRAKWVMYQLVYHIA